MASVKGPISITESVGSSWSKGDVSSSTSLPVSAPVGVYRTVWAPGVSSTSRSLAEGGPPATYKSTSHSPAAAGAGARITMSSSPDRASI